MKQRVNVPQEYRDLGAAAVAQYLERLEKDIQSQVHFAESAEPEIPRFKEGRILILGNKGAGKTALARRLLNPKAPMPDLKDSTKGVDTTLWHEDPLLKPNNTKAHIWDFAGHVITHAVHRFFLSERCLYIIVYNSRTEAANPLEYWIDHVKNYGKDSQVLILVNKQDLNVPSLPKKRLKRKYPESTAWRL